MDDDAIELQIRDAQTEVDGRLRGRYSVPFGSWPGCPELIHNVVVDTAAYLATLTYRRGKDLTPNDPIVLRYNRARDLLKCIANGDVDLDTGGDGDTPAPMTAGGLGAPINPVGSDLLTSGYRIGYSTSGSSFRDDWIWRY